MSNQPISTCSAVSEDLLLPLDGLDSEPLDSAKSNPTAKPSLKNIGRKSRFTPTSENFGGGAMEISLFSQEDSPASHSPLPGSEEARKITVISGRKCCELSRRQDPLGCLVKMLLESSTWNSTKCVLTWKPRATPSGRLLFQLVPWMPPIEETGFGFWQTPSATDAGRTGSKEAWMKYKNNGQTSQCRLRNMVQMWPTPREGSEEGYETRAKRKGHTIAMSYLETAVDYIENIQPRMYPTIRASEHKDSGPVGSKSHRHMSAKDYLCAKVKDAKQPNGMLNPSWVEWLMGYETGHTELRDSEMPSSRKSPTKSSRASRK